MPDESSAGRRESEVIDLPDLDNVLAENPLHDQTIHRYPTTWPYRRSGNPERPQIGDIAWCGHVKSVPPNPEIKPGMANCAQCLRLSAMHGSEPHA